MLTNSFGTSGVAFSPNNQYVAVGTRDVVRVADTWNHDTITSLTSSQATKFGNSKGLHFIDDRRLVIGVEGGILIWDVINERVTDRLSLPNKDFSPRAIAWSATDKMLEAFAGGDSGASGDLAWATIVVATHPVKTSRQPWCGRSTAISPDGKWLVDVYPGITKEVIQIYDLKSERRVKGLNPKGEYSCAVKFSPDGKQLLITTEKVVRLYNTETWKHRDLKLDRSK